MPENFLDLTVTSPPYDNLRNYTGECEWNFDVFQDIAKGLYRATKPGGVVVWVVGDATIKGSETGTSFRQALYFMECGFNLHDTMIYKSHKPPLTHNRYEQEFEYMFILSKGKPNTFNPIMVKTIWEGYSNSRNNNGYGSATDNRAMRPRKNAGKTKPIKQKGNIWIYKTGLHNSSSDTIAFHHSAIFPERLAADHIKTWSNEGNLVYDPFMGSGTVAKMAIKLKRNYIGSEISDKYCQIIEKRIHPLLVQTELF